MGKKQKNKEKKGNNKKRKVALFVLLIVIVVSAFFAVRFSQKMNENGSGMQGFLATMMGHNKETLKNLDKINVLLLGGDKSGLTDTIIVAQYDPMNQEASMLSIPRDTFYGRDKYSATAYYKINAIYQNKYPEKVLAEVNKLTGLDIPYYIVIDTEAIVKLVDTIGGVYFDVPIDMKYDDSSQKLYIDLKKGPQLLDGKHAEYLVRFRHNNNGSTYPEEYGIEDIGRMKTQREFISAAIEQTLKAHNILKIKSFIGIAYDNVKTNIPFSEISDYIPYATSFNTENIKTAVLPGEPELCNGVWLFIQNKNQTTALVNEMFLSSGATDAEATSTTNTSAVMSTAADTDTSKRSEIKIELLNGSSNPDNLAKVTDLLKSKGYTVSKVSSTSSTPKTTIINRKNVSDADIATIKSLLAVGYTSSGADNDTAHITIIIGHDYK